MFKNNLRIPNSGHFHLCQITGTIRVALETRGLRTLVKQSYRVNNIAYQAIVYRSLSDVIVGKSIPL